MCRCCSEINVALQGYSEAEKLLLQEEMLGSFTAERPY